MLLRAVDSTTKANTAHSLVSHKLESWSMECTKVPYVPTSALVSLAFGGDFVFSLSAVVVESEFERREYIGENSNANSESDPA